MVQMTSKIYKLKDEEIIDKKIIGGSMYYKNEPHIQWHVKCKINNVYYGFSYYDYKLAFEEMEIIDMDDIENIYIISSIEYNDRIFSLTGYCSQWILQKKNIKYVDGDDSNLFYYKNGIVFRKNTIIYYPIQKTDKLLIIDEIDNFDFFDQTNSLMRNNYLKYVKYNDLLFKKTKENKWIIL